MTPELKPDRNVFDQIASGWYDRRHYSIFRKELEDLVNRWQKGRLLNVGSGHGADFLPFKDKFELYGLDFSGEMIKMARRYSGKFRLAVNLLVGEATALPFSDNVFDYAIAVALYHHIKGREDQIKSLGELRRILKPEGEAFITVWNRCQPRFWLRGRDVAVPWRVKGEAFNRYYHLFSYWEFERTAKEAGFVVLKSYPESSYELPVKYFSHNICLLVKK